MSNNSVSNVVNDDAHCGYCGVLIPNGDTDHIGFGFEPICSEECLSKWNIEYPDCIGRIEQSKEKSNK